MFCAISGEAPQEPVVSVKSGQLYEKRLILKHIADLGTEPGSNEPLSEEDLVLLKAGNKAVKPRAAAAASIPTLLLTLQNEWDSVMLETHQLKLQLHASRLELSNALYEYDAAKRVIARLINERDEARAQLASFRASTASVATATAAAAAAAASSVPAAKSPASPTKAKNGAPVSKPDHDEEMDAATEEVVALPDEVAQKLTDMCTELSTKRRKRKPPPTLATAAEIAQYSVQTQVKDLNSAKEPAVLSLDTLKIENDDENISWLLTAGKDGSIAVLNANDDYKSLATVKAHTKPVNSAVFQSNNKALITASTDATVKTWTIETGGRGKHKISKVHSFDIHSGSVTAVSAHPVSDYFVSAGLDHVWAFSDFEHSKTILSVGNGTDSESGYSSAQIHPDGFILGVGTTDATVSLWDIKTKSNVHNISGSHVGVITSIDFSQNGYHLATTSSGENVVRFWDLRKLAPFHELKLEVPSGFKDGVSRVRFDHSAQYVAAAIGNELSIHTVKKWEHVATFSNHSARLTDFVFGADAKYLVTAGEDRLLSLLAAGSADMDE